MVSIHNPQFHDEASGKTPVSEFTDKKTGHAIRFFNNRSEKGKLAFNEQVYREYDGNRLVSERKFVNKSYVFETGEFEELLGSEDFRVDNVWGGYRHESQSISSRFLIYRLSLM